MVRPLLKTNSNKIKLDSLGKLRIGNSGGLALPSLRDLGSLEALCLL